MEGEGSTLPAEAEAPEQRASSTGGLAAQPARGIAPVARVPRRLRRVLSLEDFERAGRRFLPRPIAGFISGAAETDSSLHANREAFADLAFIPRVLVNTAGRNQATTLFGRYCAAPFGLAPMGASALAAFDGDVVLARAAAAAGIPAILSASSLIPLERVAQQAPGTWYQAYLPGEPDRIERLVDRVARAGFETFVLTADVPVPANRENNVRNGFALPLKPSLRLAWDGITHPAWLLGTAARTLMRHGLPHFENMDAHRGPPILSAGSVRQLGTRDEFSWEHLALIRRRWQGNLVVKGILAREDARIARDCGADGIIVSNHGGRQLDGAVAPLRVLADIVAEAGEMAVMLDSGVRRGTDVLKALALGAHFVFVGRPFLCAAAIAGEAGVRHGIDLLSEEIDRNMALLGITDLSQVQPELLTWARGGPR